MEDEERGLGSSVFGALLRRYRLAARLSQAALAERARMSPNGIGALERGYRRYPLRQTVAFLAKALALSDEERRAFEVAASHRSFPRRKRGLSSVAIVPGPSAPRGNLPLAASSFVGRHTEIEELAALVQLHRLVTITGAGGVGKTQTALQVAKLLSGAEDSVFFVSFAPIGDPCLVVPAIASANRVQEIPNRPLLDTLLASLNTKTLLLILDNCEHVVTEVASVVRRLLSDCPGIRILVSSREPLATAGEHRYRLPSLTVDDAAALFVDRAQAVDSHFALTDAIETAVREICLRLDGIPLAIELAAAHSNVLSITSLAEELQDRFRILTGGERTALPRQQTMRATIDWSYDLLSLPERQLFERLSVFAGGCTLAVATTVCAHDQINEGDVFTLLSSLVDKSLVIADLGAGETRYTMLETFRQYARARLTEHGEVQDISRRHAIACLDLAEQLSCAFESEHADVGRRLGNNEVSNWRTALQWALTEGGDVVLGQRLAGELSPCFRFSLATGRNRFFFTHVEGARWIADALDFIEAASPSTVRAALKYAQAQIAGNLREYQSELESSASALKHYRILDDTLGVARAQGTLGHALLYLGRRAEAAEVIGEALGITRGLGKRGRFSFACLLRLLALASTNDAPAFRAYIAEAIQIHRALGHESSLALALADLSECEFCAGNPGVAFKHAADSLAAVPPGNGFAKCVALFGMSVYLTALARYDEASKCTTEALDLAREYELELFVASTLEQLAAISVLRLEPALGVYSPAARILGFVDARIASARSARLPFVQPQYDRMCEILHVAIGIDVVAELRKEGAQMTEERSFEEASAILGKPFSC